MKRLNNREWLSVALLTVIIPVGSLTAFRLTGTLKEPPKQETIMIEAVSWNMSRPTRTITVDEWTRNSYADSRASLGFGVNVVGYNERVPGEGPPYDSDFLALRIHATVNVSEGFIFSVVARFSRSDIQADVLFEQTSSFMELHNLEIQRIRDLGAYNREVFFETTATNQPKDSLLSVIAYWMFLDENDTNHWITVNLEATYFSGTAYRKVILPILLGVTVI